ncbi:hypothetical protein G7054_g3840 [Neopestalotiopsis clavispora]|nr:hypothetical protein G7054_g3840 [Neopestalotiopsis clavispora]
MGDLASQNARHQGFTSTKGLNFRLVVVPSMTMHGRPYTQNGWRFIPSPEIQRSDGDVAIVYLSSDGVMFNQRMEDEWYRATSPGNLSATAPSSNVSKEYWRTEEPASPLGCVMQHQYCNPALPKGSDCGPLASFYDAVAGALPLFNSTDEGKFRLQWTFFMHAYGLAQLSELINHSGAASLSSQSQLYDGIQYSLSPRTQWKNDVTYWFATMSAALQAAYLNTVIGPNNSIFDDIRVTPRNDVEQDFCNSQLQLLRLAQEEAGYGIWTKCTDFVPITITSNDEKLGGLNVAQVDHPCIERMEIQNAATLSYRIETPDNKAATAPFVSVATVNTEGLIERYTTLGGESLEEILISPTSTVVEVPDGEVVMENNYVEQ